ncbi:hypothetical protein SLOPH_488 [Spraguea lophii 42_110]|uniref:Uncharacterized protein n=1 Tax=Spraguea lophii (strain 42_110) TaxID=1358809 RepID=S7XGU3_SPRLO|nr:hypothetical protein SLOPH_488 [Spraguea lophii 42_110]
MLKKTYICLFGQTIAFLISCANFIISTFTSKYWRFHTIWPFLLLLTIVHQIMIFIRKPKHGNIPYKLYILGSVLDTGAVLFLQMAFSYGKGYLILFLIQCKYLMFLGYKIFIKKEKENISFTRSFVYISIIVISFLLNFFGDSTPFKLNFYAILFTMISNVFFTMDMFIQFDVLQTVPKHYHCRTVGILGIIIALLASSMVDFKNMVRIHENNTFLKNNFLIIVLHAIVSFMVYTLAPHFVGTYSPIPFEASLLSINSHMAILRMIFNEVKIYYLLGHIACIMCSMILVYVGFKDNNEIK